MTTRSDVKAIEKLGRVRLSKSFFMRDFLYSDVANCHHVANIPDDPDLAIAAGRRLCEELLEPLEAHFGRIAIRSAFRSRAVNGYCNEHGLGCASNMANAADHIWDMRDAEGGMGATACIVVPWFSDRFSAQGDWQRLAWWIHDHLPYATMVFFPKRWAVNLQWHERPARRIDSYAHPKGCLTKPGMSNHAGSHSSCYASLPTFDPLRALPDTVRAPIERAW